ncbi:hypothetical protein [Gallid alphaherpesvirus 2]|nr:hypothetical protein [Gallid alphaherpesvirus 2]AFM74661.1 hypothetical protein [Gallid alphaherpesvirus 2]AFM74848.1 hypothetical protein [Gallid alphaherpesvirus 2]AFM74916.1 hypothetical protein [Gallid alphaherpesvirus 2]
MGGSGTGSCGVVSSPRVTVRGTAIGQTGS